MLWIDPLYYIDPAVDKSDLGVVKQKFNGHVALAGGVSSAPTLATGSRDEIRKAVHDVVSALGPDNFILAPVDALFPDTPWTSLDVMMEAWREVRWSSPASEEYQVCRRICVVWRRELKLPSKDIAR